MLKVASEIARAGGEVLKKYYGKIEQSQIDKKGIGDYVTEADMESEKTIISSIRDTFPAHEILAEESGKLNKRSQYRWIIDPLDGTANYIHCIPQFAVSIGLEYMSEMIIGVIFNPISNELFWAEKDKGAFLNERRIYVTTNRKMEDCILATGFPFKDKKIKIDAYLDAFRRLFWLCSDMRRAGSAALDLAYTAVGRVDGFWEDGLSPWDVAAGSFIVQEAGGYVTDYEGKDNHIRTGNIVASNPYIHSEILDILKKSFHKIISND